MNWFPILLVTHIALAISLLAPSLVLPFLLRRADATGATEYGPITRGLLVMQGSGSVVIALGVGITGVALLVVLGIELLGKPWLIVGADPVRHQHRGRGLHFPTEPAAPAAHGHR